MVETQKAYITSYYHQTPILIMPYAFQPIVDLTDMSIYGYEALMRPYGITPPDIIQEFIQKKDLHIVELSTFINAIRCYITRGYHEKLFINSFPNQVLSNDEFIYIHDDYNAILPNIIVEFLEYPQIDKDIWNIKKKRLKTNNILLALDDFGTGINDVEMYLNLSPDIVKIDKSLISGTKEISKNILLKSVVDLLHEYGSKVLAEGIETSDELNYILSIGFDYAQGYYIGKPQ